jgi:imidazole glycerol-phosphate synthase subunit HisF
MKRVRVIPVLGINKGRLVKTVKFDRPAYIGDPLMAIKIFNDKEVDELIICDIRASRESRDPDYNMLQDMASECFMPIGYFGGIRKLEQARKIFDLGIEKVGLSSAFCENPQLVSELAGNYGSQSVVVVLDFNKGIFGGQQLTAFSGTKKFKRTPSEAARMAEDAGAGEIVVQNISYEGTFKGYDIDLVHAVASAVRIPVVALGGASGISDFSKAIKAGASAVAASSQFVYNKNDTRSILISYPSQEQLKKELYASL